MAADANDVNESVAVLTDISAQRSMEELAAVILTDTWGWAYPEKFLKVGTRREKVVWKL